MKETFQDGVDSIYNAIVAQGVTPSNKTPGTLASAVGTVASNKYNAGAATGRKFNCGSYTGREYATISCGFTPSYVAFWSDVQLTIHGYGGNRSIVKNGSDWSYGGWDHATPVSGGFSAYICNPGDTPRTIYWFAVS